MSRKGFLSLRTSSPEYSTRFSGNHRSCGDIDREIDSSHELTFPRSIQGSTHHGRALLFSYEEFQSKQSQTSSLSSSYLPVYEPKLNSIQRGAQNFVDDDENLVDTPPDSPKGTEKWGCSACTFLNELSARR